MKVTIGEESRSGWWWEDEGQRADWVWDHSNKDKPESQHHKHKTANTTTLHQTDGDWWLVGLLLCSLCDLYFVIRMRKPDLLPVSRVGPDWHWYWLERPEEMIQLRDQDWSSHLSLVWRFLVKPIIACHWLSGGEKQHEKHNFGASAGLGLVRWRGREGRGGRNLTGQNWPSSQRERELQQLLSRLRVTVPVQLARPGLTTTTRP